MEHQGREPRIQLSVFILEMEKDRVFQARSEREKRTGRAITGNG